MKPIHSELDLYSVFSSINNLLTDHVLAHVQEREAGPKARLDTLISQISYKLVEEDEDVVVWLDLSTGELKAEWLNDDGEDAYGQATMGNLPPYKTHGQIPHPKREELRAKGTAYSLPYGLPVAFVHLDQKGAEDTVECFWLYGLQTTFALGTAQFGVKLLEEVALLQKDDDSSED